MSRRDCGLSIIYSSSAQMLPQCVSMADVALHARNTRFVLERESGEELLSRLIAGSGQAGEEPLRLAVVVAHPDDEAIGAGAP